MAAREQPSATEVEADLRTIKKLTWSDPAPLLRLHALLALLEIDRDQSPHEVVDSLCERLIAFVAALEEEERHHPPPNDRSDAFAANLLLRLQLPRGVSKVDEIHAEIADVWKREDGEPLASGGSFRTRLEGPFYQRLARRLIAWTLSIPEVSFEVPPALKNGLRIGGVTRFVPSRRHYGTLRGAGAIGDYISQAQATISMVSLNLATGVEMERVTATFARLITDRDPPIRIRVSLVNPDAEHLVHALAPGLRHSPDTLRGRITEAIDALREHAASLPGDRRGCFSLSLHSAAPSASVIMLDEAAPTGRIQLEDKPYKAALNDSYAIEVAAGSELFQTLRESYGLWFKDADVIIGEPW